MFGGGRVKIDADLWTKVRAHAAVAGYSSPTEFVIHVVEKEIARLEAADSDEEIRTKLRGLGYIS